MLTTVIPYTLVRVFTVLSVGIECESSLTVTAEATGAVLTHTIRSAQSQLSRTLVIIDAGRVVLSESRWAFTGESSNSVHTQKLTVVLLGAAFIQISAALGVVLKHVSAWTGAQIPAVSVLTDEVTGFRSLNTLVYIHTLRACDVSGVSWFTDAAEGAQCVQTPTVLTQIAHHLTLVDILSISGVPGPQRAHLPVVCVSGQRAELTVGPPAAAPQTAALRLADAHTTAGAHLTHGLEDLREAEALPVIHALGSAGAGTEALVTHTPVAAHRVLAAAILTDARLD